MSATVHELAIEVGGIPLRLSTPENGIVDMLQERYAGFLRSPSGVDRGLELQCLSYLCDPDVDLRVECSEQTWHIRRGDFEVIWDARRRLGRVLQARSPYAFDSTLRILHSLFLSEEGGFLVHAASAIRNGAAHLFAGRSGAGKTTLSRMLPAEVTLLTDEISYVRRVDEGYRAYGTPFSGELAKPGENTSAPLTSWFVLTKSDENRLERITSSGQAVRLLMQNLLFFAEEQAAVQRVFESACEFVERVPGYRMYFRNEPGAWELIR